MIMDKDREVEMLREFITWILEKTWEDNRMNEIDPIDLQDKAQMLGIIELKKVNVDDPRYSQSCEEWDTDELFIPYWEEV